MLTFWLIAAALTALVLVLLVPAMLRAPGERHADQQAQDIAIARHRLEELDAARDAGEMTSEDYAASRLELEASLAQDIAQLEKTRERVAADRSRLTPAGTALPVIIAFALPVTAGAIYLVVGEPNAIQDSTVRGLQAADGAAANRSIEVMMDQLKQRLAENPEDARGWGILARSSMQLERYDDAVDAYSRLNELDPDNPDVLVEYADALAMRAGGVLIGKPAEILEQALRLNPDQPQGLWLGGLVARHRGEYELAMTRWSRLLPQVESDPQSRGELVNLIRDLVREAEANGVALEQPSSLEPSGASVASAPASPATVPTDGAGASLTVRVSLAEDLSDTASPTDTVFVFARAVDGPPMPVAAARRRVADLPFEVTLDDSQAMIPTMKLSSFERVNVVARVSKSGQPTASSGDLEGAMDDVATNESDALSVVISRRVP